VYSAGRVPSTPEGMRTLVQSLDPTDRVALEVTGSSWEKRRGFHNCCSSSARIGGSLDSRRLSCSHNHRLRAFPSAPASSPSGARPRSPGSAGGRNSESGRSERGICNAGSAVRVGKASRGDSGMRHGRPTVVTPKRRRVRPRRGRLRGHEGVSYALPRGKSLSCLGFDGSSARDARSVGAEDIYRRMRPLRLSVQAPRRLS